MEQKDYFIQNGKLKCPNCKGCITCGAKKKTASNGAKVCEKCIKAYESSLPKES